MSGFAVFGDDKGPPDPIKDQLRNARAEYLQLALCAIIGVTAFLTFCVLRPRWAALYAARKKTKQSAAVLPELPDSLFGWIVPLWKVTDQQVLAAAGLDAYVFLAFFKMVMKFLILILFFSLIVIKPVHDANPRLSDGNDDDKGGHKDHAFYSTFNETKPKPPRFKLPWKDTDANYLWMYVVFAYLFSAIALYLVVTETRRIIEIRQEYLGTQTTITDRTIRLEGIPAEYQDEEKIKEFVDNLDIGKVESVTLCKHWGELDNAMIERMDTLRRLEEAYTIYQKKRSVERNMETLPIAQPSPPGPSGEDEPAIAESTSVSTQAARVPYGRVRPKTKIRFGRFNLRSKQVDAIDHYEGKLRQMDEKIKLLRQKTFRPTRMAFVTMDSVAAAQVAIQALLDPSPLEFIAYQSPSPSDVLWRNTYLSRRSRILRSWAITIVIGLSTLFFTVVLAPIAGLLTESTIGEVLPGVAKFLKDHPNISALVTTQIPTLLLSLLGALAPYLYYYLSWYQGMISQGEIELSVVSKNFFFAFFNFFVVFTVLQSATAFYDFLLRFGDSFDKNFSEIARTLAFSLEESSRFWCDFVLLQGLGLFPFRLLEAGSVSLYPVYRMGAKTPRDYAELVQPPVFSYGFYMPSALLIFIICTTYSVLRDSWTVILAGFIYFALGHFVYKYQLLYAMDHQQQTLGKAWGMMCDRVFIGLVIFQIATAGELILSQAIARSVLIVPLIVTTIWLSVVYGRTYKPLMKYISLRSVKRGEPYDDDDNNVFSPDTRSIASTSDLLTRNVWAETRIHAESRRRYHYSADEGDASKRFVNPSLIAPLRGVWIADKTLLGGPDGSLGSVPEEPAEEERYRDDVNARDDDDDDDDDEIDNTV